MKTSESSTVYIGVGCNTDQLPTLVDLGTDSLMPTDQCGVK